MAVTKIKEGGLGTDSFNLPITLNGTDGSSTDAGDNIVLDASASGVDAGERLLYEGLYSIGCYLGLFPYLFGF